MKEYKMHKEEYVKYLYQKDYERYYMAIDPFEESEKSRIDRLEREKAIKRNERIDSILGF
jgi:hypothetical protein